MKTIKVLASAVMMAVLSSCAGGDQPSKETESQPEVKPEQACTYVMAPDGFELLWVAYKYTEKTGVNGSFDNVNLDGIVAADHPEGTVSGASITIETSSVNSGDPTRDPKIVESFFGTLDDGETISASVTSIENGNITMDVTMNGQTKSVAGAYEVDANNKLEAKLEINVSEWDGTAAIDELNRVCEDLHKGADGSSALWPDVTLFASVKLDKSCE